MKGYLLLENGLMVKGTISGEYKNILGEVEVSALKSKVIQFNGSTFEICDDSDCYPLTLGNATKILAKLVVDALPVEYHLYDLKTVIA
ncbi:MAG: hypothetical protein AVO33_06335 [delta proteobacterium ML8_F1]|nr:MAG: hypothetical protein AVO33_06335 [delta proteobacterium ML8_F1]